MAIIKSRRTDAAVVNDKIIQDEEPLGSYHIVAADFNPPQCYATK